jgi:hypothetical protein
MAFKERYEIRLAKKIADIEGVGWYPGQLDEVNNIISELNSERHLTALAFLNTLEHMALLINSGRIDDERLVEFFKPSVPYWYEGVFTNQCPEWAEGANMFPEFRKLYTKVTASGRKR